MISAPRSLQQHDRDKQRLWDSLKTRLSKKKWEDSNDFKAKSRTRLRSGEGKTSYLAPPSKRDGVDQSQSLAGPTCAMRNLSVTNRKIGRRPFLCVPSNNHKFTPLDDDTFSTKPLIGLTTQPHQHYSEIWLADYIAKVRKEAGFNSESLTKEINAEQSQDLEKMEQPTSSDNNKVQELAMALKNEVKTSNETQIVHNHLGEYDGTSTTSHASIGDFSFVADFTRLIDDSNDEDPFDVGFQNDKRIFSLENDCKINLRMNPALERPKIEDRDTKQKFKSLDNSVKQMHEHEGQLVKSGFQDDDKRELSTTLWVSSTSTFKSSPIEPASDAFESQFEQEDGLAGQHTRYLDNPPAYEEKIIKEFHKENVCFPSKPDTSNYVSDFSERTDSLQALEIFGDATTAQMNKVAKNNSRRAKCVIVYDTNITRNKNPANVREMVVRLEAIKRLETDHAEKFGYKDFLPIQEKQKRVN